MLKAPEAKQAETEHPDAKADMKPCGEMARLTEGMTNNQARAILSDARLTLVDAGAGSGKTSVIVRRAIAQALKNPTDNIVMTTFTREAVSEMSERLHKALSFVENGEAIRKRLHVMTLGGLAFRLSAGKKVSLNGGVSYSALVKALIEKKVALPYVNEKGKAKKERAWAKMLSTAISLVIANGYDPDNDMISDAWVAEGYKLYLSEMAEAGQTSLGLVQKDASERLAADPACLGLGARVHVLVDEAQDCCLSQYNMVLFLARYGSLTLVGDDAQAIYGWRGAIPGVMRDFPRIGVVTCADGDAIVRYSASDTEIIHLEDNFRSTQAIIDVAKAPVLVEAKLRKVMHAQPERIGDRVEVLGFETKLAEAHGVLNRVTKYTERLGIENGSVAVIGRSHSALDDIANLMREKGMPFVYLNNGFFDRREYRLIRDFAFFLEDVAAQKDVRKSLSQFMTSLLGKACDLKPIDVEPTEVRSRWEGETDAYIAAAGKRKALADLHLQDEFMRLMNFVLQERRSASFYFNAIRLMTVALNVGKRYSAMGEYHVENTIEALLNVAKEADRDGLRVTGILSEYEAQERGPRMPSHVTLGTPFAMKGLEFDVVIIVGAADGQFPSRNCVGDGCVDFRRDPFRHATYGDEARNFFVAATRAKRNLIVTYSKGTSIDSARERKPSRFVTQALEQVEKDHGAKRRSEYIFVNSKCQFK